MAKDKKNDKIYFTIAGVNHYYGSDFMEKNMRVKLVKEPDNEYDNEAIKVEMEGLGKVGYVANSHYTVKAIARADFMTSLGKRPLEE